MAPDVSRPRWPIAGGVVAAVAVVVLLFADQHVPGASWIAYALAAGGTFAAGVGTGRSAFGRSGDRGWEPGTLGRSLAGWGLLFPATFLLGFAALQRLLLAAVPGSSAALTFFFLGHYVASLVLTAAASFVVALGTTVGYRYLRGRSGDRAAG